MKPQFDVSSDFFFRNIPFIENYIFFKNSMANKIVY